MTAVLESPSVADTHNGDVELVITDLDDTFWEWCTTWHAMYNGFNSVLQRSYGVSDSEIEDMWAHAYARRNGETIEFPPSYDDLLNHAGIDTVDSRAVWREAFNVSRSRRDAAFKVFHGVKETLEELSSRGVPVVAHTDSPVLAAEHRLQQAGLDGLVHSLYGRPVIIPFGEYRLEHTVPFHVAGWEAKPSTVVVNHILEEHHVDPSKVLYVGDSMRRDMRMADAAGLRPVWASYGTDYAERERTIETLVKVQRLRPFPPDASMVNEPNRNSHTKISSFSEILDLL